MSSSKIESLKGEKGIVCLLCYSYEKSIIFFVIMKIYCNAFPDTVRVLINAAGDNENAVNNVVIKSLTKIANSYPNEVIEIFCEFYTNTLRWNPVQLGNIVK